MKSVTSLTWLLAAGLLAAGALFAGEPPGEKREPIEEEQAWSYEDGGRRDPFTFVKREEQRPTGPGGEDIPIEVAKVSRIKEEARRNYNLAAQQFMGFNPRAAVKFCDNGLDAFKDLKAEDVPELQRLREALFRLRKAALRLRSRADAEQAFRSMKLNVSGVVAQERDSSAIINNRTVGKGDIIVSNEHGQATVDDILPGRVVVRFRGFKMQLVVRE